MTALKSIPDEMILREYKERFYIRKGKVLTNPIQAYHHLAAQYEKNDRERFVVLYLSGSNRLIKTEIASEGSISSAYVYARELLKRALDLNAAAVILSHNHPSGNEQPSKEDVELTQKLRELLKLMDVALLDHIIIAGDKYVSLSDLGHI